ncbi:MAG: hypothetical protein N2D54_03210, partial [Chloroflexota bacterium]
MNKSKYVQYAGLWLAIVLLISGSRSAVAAPGQSPAQTGSQAIALKYITLLGSGFVQSASSANYFGTTDYIKIISGDFVNFNHSFRIPHNKTIRKLILFAGDQNSGRSACATVYIGKPSPNLKDKSKTACTAGNSTDIQAVKILMNKKVPQLK